MSLSTTNIYHLPDEILSLIFCFKSNIDCLYVCKRWTNIIKNDFPNWKQSFNFIDYLPNELLTEIFTIYSNNKCFYVCKKWTDILRAEFTYCKRCNSCYKINTMHCCLYIYALNYNILRIMSGMAGLQYST